MRFRSTAVWIVLACMCCWIPGSLSTKLAVADDWPQWMGPQRDGVWREKGIVQALPANGPKIKWRVAGGGGYAGPAVADGRVYVMDYQTDGDIKPGPSRKNELDGTERIRCLSAKDGSVIWEHAYPCHYSVSYPVGPRATPTVDGNRVYALGTMGHLWCLNAKSGVVIWSLDIRKKLGTKTPWWGYSSHPLIDGDRLISLVGGEAGAVVAFDKNTGKVLWQSLPTAEPGYCPLSIIQAGGVRQLMAFHPQSVNGLNPETGKVYWSQPLQTDYGMSIIAPLKWKNYLFVGGIINKAFVLDLAADRPAAKVVWRAAKGRGIGPVNAPPFVEDGYLYGVDRFGELRCVQMRDGKQKWSTLAAATKGETLNSATAFLIKHDDRFFIFNEQGDLILARLSPKGYAELGRANILKPSTEAFGRKVVWSYPAFAEKCMFARNDQEVVCVSLSEE